MKGQQSPDDRHCKKCFYHFIWGEHVGCEFILVTGKRRGCEPGRNCERFLPGNPRLRWGLPPEIELEPGYLPGAVDQRSNKAQSRRRVPLNMDEYARLRREHTAMELATLTGTSKSLWGTSVPSSRSVNPTLAKRIYEEFGIDIIQK